MGVGKRVNFSRKTFGWSEGHGMESGPAARQKPGAEKSWFRERSKAWACSLSMFVQHAKMVSFGASILFSLQGPTKP